MPSVLKLVVQRAVIPVLGVFSLFFISGCAGVTSNELAQSPADGQWRFKTDLRTTSECLAAALNREYQPKTGLQQFMGRSINHQIVAIEPGKVNQVVHEHISTTTIWLFTVTAAGQGSIAEAHVLKSPTFEQNIERLKYSASSCGGTTI
jgi:hypothetical protein